MNIEILIIEKRQMIINLSKYAFFLSSLFVMATILSSTGVKPDTIKVNHEGDFNQIVIDSTRISWQNSGSIVSNLNSEISQKGKNNFVEINNNNSTFNRKNASKTKQKVVVNQIGSNNTVRINSR